MSKNYYETLGVDKNATPDEIKKAYRKKAIEHHPDKGGDEELFKELAEAYEVLSDPTKKDNFDRFGSAGPQQHHFNMNDIFSQFGDIFGNFGGFGRQQPQQRRGNDLRIKASLSLSEVMFGITRKVKYNRHDSCSTCSGQGGTDVINCGVCNGSGQRVITQQTPFGHIQQVTTCGACGGQGKTIKNKCVDCSGEGLKYKEEIIDVYIPPGALNGMQLTVPGAGNFARGGSYGDLYVVIEEIPDDKFKRDGQDINTDEWISISDAVLGTKIEIDSVNGIHKLDIPSGCESGKVFTIKGKGIPNLASDGKVHGYGDLNIKVNVKIPKVMTSEQRKAFEKLRDIL